MNNIGKRLEKILLLGVILAGCSFFLLGIALGLNASSGRTLPTGYLAFATIIENNYQDLESKWNDAQNEKEKYLADYKWYVYDSSYDRLVINHQLTPERFLDIFDELKKFNQSIKHQSPSEVMVRLKMEAKKLTDKPATIYGINIPRQIAMDVGGNQVTSSLDSVEFILQCAGAPLLILWLGAYIGTRGRELLHIQESTIQANIYPHLLNSYPIIQDKYTKKSELINLNHSIVLHKIIRVSVVFLFLVPPVAAYSASVLIFNELWEWFTPIYIFLCTQLLTAIVDECVGPASSKIFYSRLHRYDS